MSLLQMKDSHQLRVYWHITQQQDLKQQIKYQLN